MATTYSKRKALTTKSSVPFIAPPTPSNIPPMPPPKPDGVPAPFPHTAKASSADKPSTKLIVGGGKQILPGNKFDVDPPGNNPSNPCPVHDLVTGKINKKFDI
ncbi:MAG: hypothetical protein KC766_35105 [Myxococcales bacterium]|nr:hypothetical protein [Myxococcales bacterium]